MTRALEPKELLCWWWGLGLGFLWVTSDGAGLQPSGPARSHPWAPLGGFGSKPRSSLLEGFRSF